MGQESPGPFSHPWPGLDQLEILDQLEMSDVGCHKVLGRNQLTSVPVDSTWPRKPTGIRASPGLLIFLTTFKAGAQWSLSPRGQGSLNSH